MKKRLTCLLLSTLLIMGLVVQPIFAKNSSMKLYFYNVETLELVEENRVMIATPESALLELFDGPKSPQMMTPFPNGVQLIDIRYKSNVAIINLSKEMLQADGHMYKTTKMIEVIGSVLGQFAETQKFTIVVEGKQIGELGDVNFNEVFNSYVESTNLRGTKISSAEEVQPMTIPDVPHLKLVIDPGHGGHDNGAHNHEIGLSGLLEKNAVLDIGLKLRNYMNNLDSTVYMTRSNDTYLTLQQRVDYANSVGGDLFISIHNNAQGDPNDPNKQLHTANGIETYYRKSIDQQFTNTIHNHAKQAYFGSTYGYFADRGVKYAAFSVLNASMPSTLIEAGFISNTSKDYQILNNSTHRTEIAYNIYLGVRKYWWGY